MGTNYYWHAEPPTCVHCGHTMVGLHIGKSSWGWKFAFRAYEAEPMEPIPADLWGFGIKSRKEWEVFLRKGGLVMNENGDVHSVDGFLGLVDAKQGMKIHDNYPDMPGFRRTQDDEGYDMCWYEFS